LAALLVLLGVATARVIYGGERELQASTAALIAGDPYEATVRARRAASWYAPGAPHVPVAYRRLVALARAAEAHKRADIALLAWRAVRTASRQTSWVLAPHADDAALANREIARLGAAAAAEGGTHERLTRAQLELLAKPQGPRLRWVLVLLASFALAAAGLSWWTTAVASVGGRLRFDRGRAAALLVVVGVALWLLAVWRA